MKKFSVVVMALMVLVLAGGCESKRERLRRGYSPMKKEIDAALAELKASPEIRPEMLEKRLRTFRYNVDKCKFYVKADNPALLEKLDAAVASLENAAAACPLPMTKRQADRIRSEKMGNLEFHAREDGDNMVVEANVPVTETERKFAEQKEQTRQELEAYISSCNEALQLME